MIEIQKPKRASKKLFIHNILEVQFKFNHHDELVQLDKALWGLLPLQYIPNQMGYKEEVFVEKSEFFDDIEVKVTFEKNGRKCSCWFIQDTLFESAWWFSRGH